MRVLLRAFGKLEGEFEVKMLSESIYLAFMKPLRVHDMLKHPTDEPTTQKAKFEFNGKYKNNTPIYELVELA